MEKPQRRILVVDNANDPVIGETKPGDIIVSKQKFKRFQIKQAEQNRTLIVVCRWCWLDGHGKHRADAQNGTMRKDKKTGLYEHLEFCAGKKDIRDGEVKI